MADFDPFNSTFDPSVDPITADEQGLAILKKLEDGKSMRGYFGDLDALVDKEEPKLVANLRLYREATKKQGRRMFAYEPEVRARQKAVGDEELARSATALIQADEETFESIVEENGDSREYGIGRAFMRDKSYLADQYKLRKLLKQSGYSDRMIDSGAAEPDMRRRLGADEESSEPTLGAYSRWSLAKINEVDRRRDITTSAATESANQFLGMTGDEDALEAALEAANPDITNEERTLIRRIRNNQFQEMEKQFGTIKPIVRKTFNTIANEEGITTKFKEGDDEAYGGLEAAARAMGAVPRKDFPKILAMLAKTAEAHGEDVDGVMNKLGKNFTRAATGLARDAARPTNLREARENVETAKKLTGGGDDKFYAAEVLDADGNVISYDLLPRVSGTDSVIGTVLLGQTKTYTPEQVEKSTTARIAKARKSAGMAPVKFRVLTSEEDRARAVKGFQGQVRGHEYASEIYNWRETIANVGSDNMFMEDWVYGTARSLPEMAAAATGIPGIFLVASAQQERNMAEIRRKDPEGNWRKYEEAAAVAGLGYSLLNRAQFKTLSAKLPQTRRFVAEIGKRTFIEALQESGQDLTLAATLELYGALDEDIKDFDFGNEVMDTVKRFPRTMFAVAPLAMAGVGGRKAMEYVDQKAYEKVLMDKDLMDMYGIDPYHQAEIRQLDTGDALDYIRDNNSGFTKNMNEMAISEVDTGAQIIAKEDGTYSVTNGEQTVTARSPEEAAEAVQQLDPGVAVDTREFAPKPDVDETTQLRSSFGPDIAFFTDTTSETFGQIRENLPPIPMEGKDKVGVRAKFRYGLMTGLTQRPLPSKTLSDIHVEAQNLIKGVEGQFNDIAKSLDKKIERKIKKTPDSLRDSMVVRLQEQTFLAIRGDANALKRLPKDIRKDVEVARESIDLYSQAAIDSKVVTGDLATTVGDKLGSYIFRQFKAFDSKAKWGYNYVKKNEPGIYAEAFKEIKASNKKLTNKEVDQAIKKILDPTRSEDFYMGTAKAGKVSVTSFIKKQDLSPAMLNLLGEIRNPAINIRESGKKVSGIVINHAAQLRMKQQMLQMGIASEVENADAGHTYRIGEEAGMIGGKQTSKQFSGLKDVWMDPHIGKEIDAYFEPVNNSKLTPVEMVTKSMAGLTSAGKYAQVILNPASYPTNFMGGVATEVFNGRVSWDAKGIKAYLNNERLRNADRDSEVAYGSVEQAKFREQKNSTVLAAGGVNSVPLVSITAELRQGGILDSNVLAGDLKASHEAAFGENAKKVTGFFSKLYQVPDNRIKHSAFVHELSKYMKAYPNETMGDAVKRALVDTRATTQNYDMVPKFIKNLSSHGIVIPTYVSFNAELIRNTVNTGRLAARELASGNAELQKAGAKRAAGMVITGAAIQQSISTISQWMSGLDDDEREKLEALKEPWLENKNVVFLPSKDGRVRYFDPEYLVPQTMFYNALDAGFKEVEKGNVLNGFLTPVKEVGGRFTELNIFTKVSAQMVSNSNQYGSDIYNSEVDGDREKLDKLKDHAFKNMFTPGFLQTADKMRKASEEEVGFAGSTATWDDLALNIIGIRPTQKDVTNDRFLVDPLKQYAFRNTDISKSFSKKAQAELKELNKLGELDEKQVERKAELEKDKANSEAAREKLTAEFLADIKAFGVFDIPEDRLKKALKDAKVPLAMRKALKD